VTGVNDLQSPVNDLYSTNRWNVTIKAFSRNAKTGSLLTHIRHYINYQSSLETAQQYSLKVCIMVLMYRKSKAPSIPTSAVAYIYISAGYKMFISSKTSTGKTRVQRIFIVDKKLCRCRSTTRRGGRAKNIALQKACNKEMTFKDIKVITIAAR